MEKTCVFFKGDRPCTKYWSQKLYNGFDCSKMCKSYFQIKQRILIIKLDAVGDVLRSTPLAEGIKKKYPNSHLSWIVEEKAIEVLKDNPFIDRILINNQSNRDALQCEGFDLIINLDKDKKATFLANKIKAKEKRGYLLSKTGVPIPANRGSLNHYKIALDNWGEKTTNKKTFEELIFEIAEIPYNHEEYFLKIPEKDLEFAKNFKKKIKSSKKIVGITTGCGPIYPHKKYPKEKLIELIGALKKDGKEIILLGGKAEEELNKNISKKLKVIDSGSNNSLMEFASIINLCDVIFCGDTMALHIAIALNKPVVAVFGPTPSQEVNIRKGIKLVGKVPCLNCYDQFRCIMEEEGKSTCMETIEIEEIKNSINKLVR